jgi:hypothetical protein
MAPVSRATAQVLAFACLGGCTSLTNLKDSSWVSAEPLDARLVDALLGAGRRAAAPGAAASATPTKIDVWALVNDSSDKCHAFADRITASQTQLHATGDLSALAFSTLGTLFHPANTVRALSAGATLSSGAMTALDTDLFAKAGFAAFRLALQSTYERELDKYKTGLEQIPGDDFDPGAELLKVKSIHSLCGLAPVEGSILASVSPASAPAAAPPASAPAPGAAASPVAAAAAAAPVAGSSSAVLLKPQYTTGAIGGLPVRR